MTHILQINSSLFSGQGVSTQLADDFVKRWQEQDTNVQVVRHDLAATPIPHLDADRLTEAINNGLTAEATHVYHPGTPLRVAYRVLFEQWRIAFAIAEANRARGATPATLRELARLVRRARR